MNAVEFTNISIRGRVAFAICCLEHALVHFDIDVERWRFVLEKLWSYMNIEYLDDWHYTMSEMLPENVLEVSDVVADDRQYINEEQFTELYRLYTNTDELIKQIMIFIFDIGTCELYGGVRNYSQPTLNYLGQLIRHMQTHRIRLPEVGRFQLLAYEEREPGKKGEGWGRSFVGVHYSSLSIWGDQ